jgi:predicted nucleic acid-binding protein
VSSWPACASTEANVAVLDDPIYSALEDEARARALRDPADWPVVARALALSAAIWTNDNDFLGTGVATWTTKSLKAWLDRS